MKILYLANLRLPTEKAYGLQIGKMCEAFAKSGLEVTLVYPYRQNHIPESIFDFYNIKNNFELRELYSPDFYWPGSLDRFSFLIKSFIAAVRLSVHALVQKPDIIYTRDELPAFLMSLFRSNVIFEMHKFSSRRMFFYKAFRMLETKVVCISEGLKKELDGLGFLPENIIVSHDGVDVDEFNVDLGLEEARRQLNLPQKGHLLGYVGSLTTMGERKGLDELFEAFKMIGSGSHLVVVGSSVNPAEVKYYKEYAERLGLSEEVIFVGRVPYGQVPVYLKAFDVLAMPFPNTKHYATYMSPLKLFEYMASDRPIVATRLPSVTSILNERNSVLVEPGEVKSLADGIKKILENKNFATQIANQALEDVKFSYTWEKRAAQIISFARVS